MEVFVKRGLALDGGASWSLPRQIGLRRAKQMTFFGDPVEAAQAYDWGLVNEVVPPEQLLETAKAWGHRLASGPTTASEPDQAAARRELGLELRRGDRGRGARPAHRLHHDRHGRRDCVVPRAPGTPLHRRVTTVMDAVTFTDAPELVRGALALQPGFGGGVLPRRLPEWTRAEVPDVVMDTTVSLTAGVRVELVTDSPVLELELSGTAIAAPELAYVAPAVELVVDGDVAGLERAVEAAVIRVESTAPGEMKVEFEPGSRSTLRFDLGPAGVERRCQLWLPTGASVELHELRLGPGAHWSLFPPGRRRWVHYGSSISHCAEVDRPSAAWPIAVALRRDLDLVDLAFAGQCQLDPFVARTIRDLEADCISMKVGINFLNAASMTERTFAPALHGFLDIVREGHPGTPLLLVSPIFCPLVEDHPGPTIAAPDGDRIAFRAVELPPEGTPLALTARRIREIVASMVASRRDDGDGILISLDGLALLSEADEGSLHDRLHPDAAGYRLLRERFEAVAFGTSGPLATA